MKKQIFILLVLIFLASLAYFTHQFFQTPTHTDHLLLTTKREDVTRVQINHFTFGMMLEKKGSDWFVSSIENELLQKLNAENPAQKKAPDTTVYRARRKKIEDMLDVLFALRVSEPIATQNDVAHKAFEIGPHSLHVIFFDAAHQEKERLYLGKQGPEPFTFFVKRGGDSRVYLIDKNLRSLIQQNFDDWRD